MPKDRKQSKLSNPYKATTRPGLVKDASTSSRTVRGLFNTYFYIDSDMDMLIPGAATKSIQERGVGTTTGNKIMHLLDHDWTKAVARLDVLEERSVEYDGRTLQGIYHESYYPETTKGTDTLINIVEGVLGDRSIGFEYVSGGLTYCEKDSDIQEERESYERYIQLALNPEVAENRGYFWVVSEIKLWEGSDVAFGANAMTPFLGTKGKDKENMYISVVQKMSDVLSALKEPKLSDEGHHTLEMQIKQLESTLSSLKDIGNVQPSKKSTPPEGREPKEDTVKPIEYYMFN
jgi:phage head maturation protease